MSNLTPFLLVATLVAAVGAASVSEARPHAAAAKASAEMARLRAAAGRASSVGPAVLVLAAK